MSTIFSSTSSLNVVARNSGPGLPYLVACVSSSLGFRSKGFVEETAVDLSQIRAPLNTADSFLFMIQTISFEFKMRQTFFLQTSVELGIFSLQPFFSASQWSEREIHEMFGLPFSTDEKFELDLRRLLTDYGFSGFPLRKNYPAVGYSEIRYDPSLDRIVEESLSLDQLPPIRKDWFSWHTPQQLFPSGVSLEFCGFELAAVF
jgi:NADH:ubiquinone oxidoreductase subunit C